MVEANVGASISKRRGWEIGIAAALVLTCAFAAWYLTSGHFREVVRARVVTRLEEITGGRVELGSFRWNLSALEIEATDLTIHGLEGRGEIPYLHVDRLYARLEITSMLRREIALKKLVLTKPQIHVIVNADGTTNLPSPKRKPLGNDNPVQTLIELAIERIEMQQGELLWNQRRVPLDMAMNDLQAELGYLATDKRYDGRLHVGKVETQWEDFRRFASMADVEFSLYADRAQVKSLKIASGKSTLGASGSLSNFREPKIELAYEAKIDLGEAGSIARHYEFRRGTMELKGQGAYSLTSFAATGKMLVKNATYQNDVVNLADVTGGADYAVNPERMSLPHLYARAFGGDVRGDIDIKDWMETTPPDIAKKKGASAKAETRGIANLQLTGIPVAQIANAFSSKKLPLNKMNLAGTSSGTVIAKWQGSAENANAEIAMEAVPPSEPAQGKVPVTASVRGTYHVRAQVMDIARGQVATGTTTIDASGALGSTKANLQLAVTSSNIHEFQPLMDAIRGREPMPVAIAGPLSFKGTVSGKLTSPSIAGSLDMRDFVTIEPASEATQNQERRLHWDELSGDVRWSPVQAGIRNGVLKRGTTGIELDAMTALNKGNFTDASPFTLRMKVRDADAAEVQSLAGLHYPVTGKLEFDAQVSGTKRDARGSGRANLTNGVAYGQKYRSASADLAFMSQEVQLRNIAVVSTIGRISGTAAYNFQSTAFGFELHGTEFQLAAIEQLKKIPKVEIAGTLGFDATGAGTTAVPVINAKLRASNLIINGEKVGSVVADAVTRGEELQITARSSFQNAGLTVDGTVYLRGNTPGHLLAKFNDVTLDPVLRTVMTGRMTGHTVMAGTVEVNGPMKEPSLLNVDATITRFTGEAESIKVHNVVPLKFTLKNQVVTIESFRLEGEESHFLAARGTAELSGERRVNMRLDGRVNMKLIQSVSPDLVAYGTTDFGVSVGGTVDHPSMRGQMQIANGGISYVDLPNGLSNINGTLVFTQDRLLVQKLTARTGGGDLQLGGFISYDRTLNFSLTARGTDIRMRYPPGVSSTGNADLVLAGTLKNSLLSGEIVVTRFGLNPRFDFASYVTNSKQPSALTPPDSPLNGLRLDVHILSTPQLRVETSLAKISGDVDLRLRGTATKPAVLGRVNIVEGDVFFNGTQYHLERGDVTFTNPVKIEPVMDIEASARVRDYDITLGFHGSADKLNTTYRSDPPLPTADIIALLALGRTREESAGLVQTYGANTNASLTESASNAILGTALNAAVSSRVQKLFGVSRIKIDPQVGGPENNPNARLTVEQQVSNNITLTYITNLSQSAQQIIQVEYNINRNVSILAVRDQNGVVGFDVRIRQRKR